MCVMVYIRCLWSVYKKDMSVYRCNISGGQGEDAHGDVDADVSFLVFGAFDLSCSASNRCM